MGTIHIPGYSLDRLLGQGGMASVYLAIQESLQRPVALKILSNPETAEFSERFLNEGRIIAALNHTHIITIHDVGIADGTYYIAMEYVEGGDLKKRIAQPMTPHEALDVVKQIGACLGFVHQQGIVHRDVKPANILFRRDGTPLLTDFGIAKQLQMDSDLTATGTALGSPHYLSPEQAQGLKVDGRTDIYSLGIILYEMLTGTKPYQGDTQLSTIMMHLQEPIPQLPPELTYLQDLLNRMLAKHAEDRFQTAAQLLAAVQQLRLPAVSEQIDATLLLAEIDTRSAAVIPTPPGLADAQEVPAHATEELLEVAEERLPGPPQQRVSVLKRKPIYVGVVGVLLFLVMGTLAFLFIDRPALFGDHPATPPDPAVSTANGLSPAESGQDESNLADLQGDQVSGSPPIVRLDDQALLRQAFPEIDAEAPQDRPEVPSGERPVWQESTEPVSADEEASQDGPSIPASSGPTQQEIAGLLASADRCLDEYRLMTPPHDNALYYYQEVLGIDPGNREARQGLNKIAVRYAQLAERHLRSGNYTKAGEYIARGLTVQPDNERLQAIRDRLSQGEFTPVAEQEPSPSWRSEAAELTETVKGFLRNIEVRPPSRDNYEDY